MQSSNLGKFVSFIGSFRINNCSKFRTVRLYPVGVFSSIREHYILIGYYWSVNYSLIIKERVNMRCSLSTDDCTEAPEVKTHTENSSAVLTCT